ncbi:MAG: single-stranded DNA-binding protein [Acidobacteria bacterium]|nr:single-stranded DNA-binding protein [Acidobacteriota bacterium]
MSDQTSSGRSGNRKTATTGKFRFAQAHVRGVVVRDGPERRVSPKGAEWMEMTILVGLYDGAQKCERERPAFVRVKAFGERADLLDGIEKRDHVSVAGTLALDVWTGREGDTRESWEIYADAVSREKFPDMAELIRRNEAAAPAEEPSVSEAWDDAADPGADVPWNDGGGSEGGAPADPNDTEDDIPF